MARPIIDLTGQRFGRLVVLRFVRVDREGAMFDCMCDCGNNRIVASHRLRKGVTRSCGCITREIAANLGKTTGSHNLAAYRAKYGNTAAALNRVDRLLVAPYEFKRRSKASGIYLMDCSPYMFHKIGIARDASRRKREIDVISPLSVHIRAQWQSIHAEYTESALHAYFREYHHKNEWFILPPHIAEELAAVQDIDSYADSLVGML